MTVLDIRNLTVEYRTPRGPFHAVRNVSFSLEAGERFGLVGESGSGKSTTILALMRMLRGGMITGGELLLNGRDLAAVPDARYRTIRFAEMSLVPQGAMSSLNPVLKIGRQIGDIFADHRVRHTPEARRRIIGDLLARVGLAPEVQDRFPHELSGGMKQRVCIAMAIALKPSLILADEPTSALDVMVQKQVLATLGRVQRELGAAIVLIGHDMALMAHFVGRLGVMYRGELVETGPVREIFTNPQHPYTRMLIDSLPSFDRLASFRTAKRSPVLQRGRV
ncbi:ABC transporter ATP-binding protein [Chelatococcus asaccharovorans]|uniref:Peptide/nickel transport system ATP-binding protein n=1 Tax=Chelatococcus asaccharovorans TaxID=28210 RepID=A0A2V3UQS9_9HYPH|nr:ABC transporter ATP-binding protein [Chelatococcus asaccharovorans]MBS7706910.1 ABC transporter ATP-binding protein [Chelatococcus asaccharovorans]PXW63089.1 peptide/nickel transport system ATP-binding protein [Chelatococcus asaccharovorans]